MTLQLAALLAAILLFALALFHASLALGAPLGAFAWGGENDGALPPRLRRGSTLMAPLVAAMGAVVLIRGGWIYPDEAGSMTIPVWAIFVVLVLQLSGALRSQSQRERRVMGLLYGLTVALLAYVSFGHAT